MARQLIGDPKLEFVLMTALEPPPEVKLLNSNWTTEQKVADMAGAEEYNLPDDHGGGDYSDL